VLAAISFNLKFTYILVGWEGSAHDSCVLNDALSRLGRFTIPKSIIGRFEVFGLLFSIFVFFFLLKISSDFVFIY